MAALYDLNHTSRYRDVLQESGMTVEVLTREFLWLVPSRSLVGRKGVQ